MRIYNPPTFDITTATFTVMAARFNFRPEAIEVYLAIHRPELECSVRKDPDTACLFGYSITFKVYQQRMTKVVEAAQNIVDAVIEMEAIEKAQRNPGVIE